MTKTGRLFTVEAGNMRAGVGADIVAQVIEGAFDFIDVPPVRLAVPDVPIPFAPQMEDYVIPGSTRIVGAVRNLLNIDKRPI